MLDHPGLYMDISVTGGGRRVELGGEEEEWSGVGRRIRSIIGGGGEERSWE